MRFMFELEPLADVQPWGGDHPSLHWFGLTSGWYWIEGKGEELLRYRDDTVLRGNLARPYPDYYVARLWEDMLELLPALSESVPQDLVPFVNGTFASRESPDNDESDDDDVVAAFVVMGDHELYLSYTNAAGSGPQGI